MLSTRRLVTSTCSAGAGIQQLLHEGRGRRDLLEIVHEQEGPADVAQVFGDRLLQREILALTNTERPGHSRGHQSVDRQWERD